MKQNKYILSFILCLSSLFFFSQGAVDSLKKVLNNTHDDTTRLHLRCLIGDEDFIFRLGYWDSIYNDARKINAKRIESACLTNIGYIYRVQGDIQKALEYYDKSLKLEQAIGNKKGIAESYNNIGFVYDIQGNIPQALKYYHESLKRSEEIGDKSGIAYLLHNIAFVYSTQGDISKALNYHEQSLKLMKELNDKSGIAHSLTNMGVIYGRQGNNLKALSYFIQGLKYREETGDKSDISNSLSNIGSIYTRQNKLDTALIYFEKSLKLRNEIDDKHGIASALENIGTIYLNLRATKEGLANKKKNLNLAASNLNNSLAISKELGFPELISNAHEILAKIDSANGDYKGAFEHYKQFIIYRDSISNESTRKASVKSQLNYEFEKKEAVIKEQQEKERAIANETNRFQQIVIASVLIGLLLVIFFAAFIFRSLKTTRHQKLIIEEKQKEILDSIRYAKRIQKSLLPTDKYISKQLSSINKEN